MQFYISVFFNVLRVYKQMTRKNQSAELTKNNQLLNYQLTISGARKMTGKRYI